MCLNEIFDWTVLSLNFLSFLLFSDCGKNILQHWRKNFRKIVKGAFYLNNNTFRGKFVILKKILTFTIFSSFDEKLCGLLSEILPRGLKNCFPHSFGGSSCITLSLSSRKLTPTNNFEWKCSEDGKNFFDMVVKTALFVSSGDFWRIFFFFTYSSKFSVFFGLWGNFFRFFGENNLVGLSKVFSGVEGGFLGRIDVWKQIFWIFYFFFGLRAQKFGLLAKFFRRLCQNCILCVQWRFLIGLFFLQNVMTFFTVFGLWGKFSRRLAQKLQKHCQNCYLPVPERFSGKFWFLKKENF